MKRVGFAHARSREAGSPLYPPRENAVFARLFTSRLPHDRIVSVRVVDLSQHNEDGMPVFPGLPDPSFKPIAGVEQDGY